MHAASSNGLVKGLMEAGAKFNLGTEVDTHE